jgi:CubicO group peptidase (beta-lactamase class C family)
LKITQVKAMTQHLELDSSQIHAALERFATPGLAVAVVKNDALVLARGYGQRGLDHPTPVDEHTLFAIGSISKSFTATSLGLLVDEGKLAWDDPVQKYLPDFQLFDPYATHEITIRDLLTHRSGLAEVSGGTIWYGSTYDRTEVVKRIRHLKPVSSFRSQFAYQNIMYLVAGQLIPALTGSDWDTFVQERLFKPLHMTDSVTSMTELQPDHNVVTPHITVDGKAQAVAHRNYDNVAPAASIYSSVVDMAQYLRLHLRQGRYADQQLLSIATAQEMATPQMVIPIRPNPPALAALTPEFYAYGLGWFIRNYRGRKVVTHSGGVDGLVALATMVPEEELGIVALINQESALAAAVGYSLLDAYLGAPAADWYEAFLQARREATEKEQAARTALEDARVKGTQPALALEQYAGTYHADVYGEASVMLEDDHLVLRFGQTPSFTGDLEHWHYDTFRIHWRDPMITAGLVTFPLTAQGKPFEMKFDQSKLLDVDFAELEFTRVPAPGRSD